MEILPIVMIFTRSFYFIFLGCPDGGRREADGNYDLS